MDLTHVIFVILSIIFAAALWYFAPKARSTAQTINENSIGHVSLGPLKFWALGDRVLIEEDEFRSGYECTHCGGSGKAPCGECGGRGAYFRGEVEVKCSHCENGAVVCPECAGKGGLIVAPEIAQRRPTTGVIASVGPGHYQNGLFISTCLRVGQRVMYSNFAGYVVDLTRAGKRVTIRILHEPEILCAMEGQLEMRNFTGKTEIAEVSK